MSLFSPGQKVGTYYYMAPYGGPGSSGIYVEMTYEAGFGSGFVITDFNIDDSYYYSGWDRSLGRSSEEEEEEEEGVEREEVDIQEAKENKAKVTIHSSISLF